MNDATEAMKIYKALREMFLADIDERTKSCIRAKKMTVTTAPANNVIGVTEAFGTELFIPYSSAVASATVGQSVWVKWYYNDATTLTAYEMGSGV